MDSILILAVVLITVNVLGAWMFFTWFNKALTWVSRGCWHAWLDTSVPFSDMKGGWHQCTKCEASRYIHWGWWYQRELAFGRIATDKAKEKALMEEYTGFSEFTRRPNHETK